MYFPDARMSVLSTTARVATASKPRKWGGRPWAAWASGALTLEQAVRVIYHRSRLQSRTKGRGGMTAVALGDEPVRELLAQLGLGRALSVAGVNSSSSVTVAPIVNPRAGIA